MKYPALIGEILNFLTRGVIGASRPASIAFAAVHDLVQAEGYPDHWRATGDDPIFHLNPGRSMRPYAGRWVRIQSDIRPIGRTRLAPTLYFDTGAGYSETRSIKIRTDKHGIDDWIYIPGGTRSIRFDPMAAVGEFRMNYIKLRKEPFSKGIKKNYSAVMSLAEQEARGVKAVSRAVLTTIREDSLRGAWDRFVSAGRPKDPPASYYSWIETVEKAESQSVAEMRAQIAAFAFTPLISIVMPVYNTPRRWLEEAIRSIRDQAYENWELCLCDDNSSEAHIWPMLKKYASEDARIKLHKREQNGRISLASNDAMALATGAYMTLMDHDDIIPVNALYEFVKVLNADRTVDFIYSDEDKLSISGVRYEPFFKPDWSPETLEACMYTAHLALYRMDIVQKVGGFRDECNGAQDYDFVLRYTEHVRNVVHIPKVLYHWRAIPGSTAQRMDNKDYVIDAALRALSDRARRTGELDFARCSAYAGCFELRRRLKATPLVSIVIPSAGRDSEIGGRQVDLLAACITSIHAKSTYKNIEIVVVDNGDLRPQTVAVLDRFKARSVTYSSPTFNVAAKMNLGARAAKGEVLIFLNDDIEVITPDWIEAMLALLEKPGVGAVGPKLLFETGEIQHAGVTFSDVMPDHVRRGYPGNDAGYFFSTAGNRNYLAVTGACVMVRGADFERVGRFDEDLAINYNDIDLCLRLYEQGLRIVYCAQASLYHYESRNRVRSVEMHEQDYFRARWSTMLKADPYYSSWFEHQPPTYQLDPVRFFPMEA